MDHEIRHASPGLEGSNNAKPPSVEEIIDDIPKGDYIRWKDGNYEVKTIITNETEKAVELQPVGLKDAFWFPKSTIIGEDSYQKGLVKWRKIMTWILKQKKFVEEES